MAKPRKQFSRRETRGHTHETTLGSRGDTAPIAKRQPPIEPPKAVELPIEENDFESQPTP
ncbi:MAG TPA: hypothetical protein VIY09_02560 [Rhizomicrobium sp.]